MFSQLAKDMAPLRSAVLLNYHRYKHLAPPEQNESRTTSYRASLVR